MSKGIQDIDTWMKEYVPHSYDEKIELYFDTEEEIEEERDQEEE